MSERSEYAVELFRKGFSCSQSVFAAYSDLFGLDQKTALRISDGFGGGIARRQDLCGAVSGAVMLLGLRYGRTRAEDTESHERTFSYVNRLCEEFTRKYRLARLPRYSRMRLAYREEQRTARLRVHKVCARCLADC